MLSVWKNTRTTDLYGNTPKQFHTVRVHVPETGLFQGAEIGDADFVAFKQRIVAQGTSRDFWIFNVSEDNSELSRYLFEFPSDNEFNFVFEILTGDGNEWSPFWRITGRRIDEPEP